MLKIKLLLEKGKRIWSMASLVQVSKYQWLKIAKSKIYGSWAS